MKAQKILDNRCVIIINTLYFLLLLDHISQFYTFCGFVCQCLYSSVLILLRKHNFSTTLKQYVLYTAIQTKNFITMSDSRKTTQRTKTIRKTTKTITKSVPDVSISPSNDSFYNIYLFILIMIKMIILKSWSNHAQAKLCPPLLDWRTQESSGKHE